MAIRRRSLIAIMPSSLIAIMPPTPSHRVISDSNPIKAIVQYARKHAPKRGNSGRGRPPKYREWKLAALCMLKTYLNTSFDKLTALAPYIIGETPSKATIYRAWLRLAEWAEQALAELQGSAGLAVVDSTGLKGWRKSFKLHIAYSLEREKVLAVEATRPNFSDAKGLKILLKKLKGPGILVADSAYFGVNLFKASAEKDLLLLAKPRKPPRGYRRRGWARRLEVLYEAGSRLYRRRGEGERGCFRLKYATRWRVFYVKVESCRAHMLYLALAMAVAG